MFYIYLKLFDISGPTAFQISPCIVVEYIISNPELKMPFVEHFSALRNRALIGLNMKQDTARRNWLFTVIKTKNDFAIRNTINWSFRHSASLILTNSCALCCNYFMSGVALKSLWPSLNPACALMLLLTLLFFFCLVMTAIDQLTYTTPLYNNTGNTKVSNCALVYSYTQFSAR